MEKTRNTQRTVNGLKLTTMEFDSVLLGLQALEADTDHPLWKPEEAKQRVLELRRLADRFTDSVDYAVA